MIVFKLVQGIPTGIPAWGYPLFSFNRCGTTDSDRSAPVRHPRQPSAFPHGLAGTRSHSTKASGSLAHARVSPQATSGSGPRPGDKVGNSFSFSRSELVVFDAYIMHATFSERECRVIKKPGR